MPYRPLLSRSRKPLLVYFFIKNCTIGLIKMTSFRRCASHWHKLYLPCKLECIPGLQTGSDGEDVILFHEAKGSRCEATNMERWRSKKSARALQWCTFGDHKRLVVCCVIMIIFWSIWISWLVWAYKRISSYRKILGPFINLISLKEAY